MKIKFDWILITNHPFDTSLLLLSLTPGHWDPTYSKVLTSSHDPFCGCTSPFNNTIDYSLHDQQVLLLVVNTQSRVTSSTPVISDGPLPCTPQLHYSTSVQEPHHAASMESFSILPHSDCSYKNNLKKKVVPSFFPTMPGHHSTSPSCRVKCWPQ
jgi:hypothetical protein